MKGYLKQILVLFFDNAHNRNLRKKLRKIFFELGKNKKIIHPPGEILSQYKKLWHPLSSGKHTGWLKMYGNISGIWDYRYVAEPVYYSRIEPCLNNKAFSKAYTDKNFYQKTLYQYGIPETIIRNIEGKYYNNDGKNIDEKDILQFLNNVSGFIIKPAIDSGGGKGVALYHRESDKFIDKSGGIFVPGKLSVNFGKNFIIQELIEQHLFYSQFNETSVNTVRILTYRSIADEKVNILQSILRIGRAGSITDNQASGGFACGLTSDGFFRGEAVDKFGRTFKIVNGIELNTGVKMTGYGEIISVATNVAGHFPYARLLGQDLCVDKSGRIRLIEVNNLNNEINFFQMQNGPLFREYTNEIVDYCSSQKRSFLIDYDI